MLAILKSLKKYMKNTSAFYFKYFGSDELPVLFAALKRVFDVEHVPFYLIGARARDVWFLPQKQTRITLDIDWIVASSEKSVFENITHVTQPCFLGQI